MKTEDLEGLQLDYWVALAEGRNPEKFSRDGHGWIRCVGDLTPWSPSTLWGQAGPIIEAHIKALTEEGDGWYAFTEWDTMYGEIACSPIASGPTLLIAAMRARVAMVYGDEVPDPP